MGLLYGNQTIQARGLYIACARFSVRSDEREKRANIEIVNELKPAGREKGRLGLSPAPKWLLRNFSPLSSVGASNRLIYTMNWFYIIQNQSQSKMF